MATTCCRCFSRCCTLDTVVPDTFTFSNEASRQRVSVSVLLQFEAKKRVSAEDAIRQSYFKSLGAEVQTLADSEFLGSRDEPPLPLLTAHVFDRKK